MWRMKFNELAKFFPFLRYISFFVSQVTENTYQKS